MRYSYHMVQIFILCTVSLIIIIKAKQKLFNVFDKETIKMLLRPCTKNCKILQEIKPHRIMWD